MKEKTYEELRKELYPASEKVANTISLANKRSYEIETDIRKMFPCILHEIYSKLKKIVEAQNHERAEGSPIPLEEQLLTEAGLITYEESYGSHCCVYHFKPTQKGIEIYNKLNQEEKHLKTR